MRYLQTGFDIWPEVMHSSDESRDGSKKKETDDVKWLLIKNSGVPLILVLGQMVRFCLKSSIP